MPRVLIFVFAALAAATATTAVYFARENRALRDEIAELRARPLVVAPPTPTPALAPPAAAAPVDVASGPAVAAAAPAESATVREGGRREGDRRERGQEFFARALADPESRAAMLTRAKGQIDRMFGDYFVRLGLNETQIEGLRTLLAERQLTRMESGMLERAAETDQERADAQAWRDAKLASTETDINTILGTDGLKNLQSYLDSAPQRQVVDEISRRATYAGAPLTTEASDRLLATVRQAEADVPLPQLPGRGRWNGGEENATAREPLTTETVSTYLSDLRTRNQQIIDGAREFLTQPQLEALADQQIDELQQAEAQLNFMVRNPDARGLGGGFGGGRRPGG